MGDLVKVLLGVAAACLLFQELHAAFVGSPPTNSATPARTIVAHEKLVELSNDPASSKYLSEGAPMGSLMSVLAGVCLGIGLVASSPRAALADIEDVAIAVNEQGKTTILSKEQLIRGKRLFNVACATCHVAGGTRTNQNVGLALEELAGAAPPRSNIENLVQFLNAPTTYDGLYDISENHPSIKSADVFPKMRSMKQQDLYDISSYILYQNQTIPEKWGGGKTYY